MGWASASGIMDTIIDTVKAEVKDKEARKRIYRPIIGALEDGDWDTQDECVGQDVAYDELFYEMYPEEAEDQEDQDDE